MDTRPALLTLAVAVTALVAGCQSHAPKTREYVVNFTSATPVTFSGKLRVDGKDQSISGTTPARYTLVAGRIDCQVTQGPENGLLTVQIRPQPDPDSSEKVFSSLGPNTALHGTVQVSDFWSWLH